MVTKRFCCVAMLIVFAFQAYEVRGAAVTFAFQATVSDVPTELASQFSLGQSITGNYTFESTTARVGDSYLLAITSFNADIAGYALTSVGNGDIQVVNGATDTYLAVAFSAGSNVGAFTPLLHAIQLNDNTGTALSDGSLPLTPPALAGFADRRFTFDFSSPGGGSARLTGTMDSFTAVPEPSSLALVGVGVVALALRRRR